MEYPARPPYPLGLAQIALGQDNDCIPHIWCELSPESGGICVLSRGENMNHWIDLLIVIPSWLGVFAVIGALVATVAG